MDIYIKTIPHKMQRYDTVGDWWFEADTLHIRVSDMGDPNYEFLVAFHEQAEAMLCLERGIPEDIVMEFDKKFEEERSQGLHDRADEPGLAKDAPYRNEHFFANIVEGVMANELGVNIKDYEETVMSL